MDSDAIDLARETILCYECGQSMLHWQFVYHAYDNHNANNASNSDTPGGTLSPRSIS